jgi:hypothetical protein
VFLRGAQIVKHQHSEKHHVMKCNKFTDIPKAHYETQEFSFVWLQRRLLFACLGKSATLLKNSSENPENSDLNNFKFS